MQSDPAHNLLVSDWPMHRARTCDTPKVVVEEEKECNYHVNVLFCKEMNTADPEGCMRITKICTGKTVNWKECFVRLYLIGTQQKVVNMLNFRKK